MIDQSTLDKNGQVFIHAERELAYTSPDYRVPWGTRRDNSRNRRFNEKLYYLFAFPGKQKELAILDLGCSGGGFVKDCIDDGCFAIGLEGSDYSKKHHRAEWATIPDFLFTCDVTGNFDILKRTQAQTTELVQFDVVTSWELIEHIAEHDLATVANNVRKHLLPGGLWAMSVSPNVEVVYGETLHQTVKPKAWWITKFKQLGFHNLDHVVQYFNTQFVRGPKYGAPGSFHLVLSCNPAAALPVPPLRLQAKLYDFWLGSRYQRFLKNIIVGK